jgi:hypothetical protein
VVADALSRKDKLTTDKDAQLMLPREVLEYGVYPDDSKVPPVDHRDSLEESNPSGNATLIAPVTIMTIVERIIASNQTHESLEEFREMARNGHEKWTLQAGMLLREGKLIVLDKEDLRVRLLDKVYR